MESIWQKNTDLPSFPKLEEAVKTDVLNTACFFVQYLANHWNFVYNERNGTVTVIRNTGGTP